MAGALTQIDLALLEAPSAVEPLDFEAAVAAMKADVAVLAPDLAGTLDLESEPIVKLIEVVAYRELLTRQRVNDGARAVMLAYATGADLDQLAALFGVARLLVDPGNPDAIPPVPPTYERDAEFRARVQLAPESWTSAGSRGAYVFHALSADGGVRDVSVTSPEPGDVLVSVLSRNGDGTADAALIAAVADALNDQDVRPLTDTVTVQAATILTYTIEATITTYPGPDPGLILTEAENAAQAYADAQHRIGRDVTLSGVFAALHRPGVQNVALTAPLADIVVGDTEAAYCTAITLTDGGTDV